MNTATAGFKVDYPAYLSKHDIVFLSPPDEGWEGFPIGNGNLGGMIWCTQSGFRMQVNKTDTWDHTDEEVGAVLRSCGQLSIDFGAPCTDWMYLDDFEGRLSLAEARASFAADTPFMKVSVGALVRVDRNVIVLKCRVDGRGDLAANGSAVRIGFERWGSRAHGYWYAGIHCGAARGLGKARAAVKGGDLCVCETLNGTSFAVACRMVGADATPAVVNARRAEFHVAPASSREFTVLIAVATSNESDDPARDVVKLLDETVTRGVEKIEAEHRQWWNDFWSRSFVHIGDDYIENLYYLHLYLMGSSSRGMYPAVFNGAIWTWNHDVRNWVNPHHWNEQQAYWCLNAANHSELMRPYLDTYWRLVPKAEAHAKMRGYDGAILWSEPHEFTGKMVFWDGASFIHSWTQASEIGQYFWHYWLYTGDETFLKERAYPFMKKAAEFYLKFAQKDEDGNIFFAPASAYESEIGNEFRNTTPDLSVIHASFHALIRASTHLGVDAEKRKEWQSLLDALPDYAYKTLPDGREATAMGWMKDGKTMIDNHEYEAGFATTVAPVFPHGNVGLDQAGSRLFDAIANRVRVHPPFFSAIVPTAIVAARLGMADEARDRLSHTIRQLQHFPQGLFFNVDHWHYQSRYAKRVPDAQMFCQRDYITDRAAKYTGLKIRDMDRKINMPTQPFVQCGLEPMGILGQAVNEMLMQSYNGMIRVFPAVPADWPAAFTLRAVGGFLVTSERAAGQEPEYVLVRSLLGNECTVVNPWPGRDIAVQEVSGEAKPVKNVKTENRAVSFATARDATYLLTIAGKQVSGVTVFTGSRNSQPKQYQEAILGKHRDF